MAKKLHSPEQPLVVQYPLRLFEFCASLKLAVVLIFSAAFTLAWATFVESEYGTPVVQYAIYGSWWFGVLNLLLAINIFSAAAIRYPWKRYQTGFVITHIGLLVLLLGCLISRRGAIDAQMPIFEDGVGHRAFTDAHNLQLAIHSGQTLGAGGEGATLVTIPFHPGPFNWQGQEEAFRPVPMPPREPPPEDASVFGRMFDAAEGVLGRVPIAMKNLLRRSTGWAVATVGRDEGVLYDRDGVRVEVLDYYANSHAVDAPLVELELSMPRGMKMGPDGKPVAGEMSWVPVNLRIPSSPLPDYPYGMGADAKRGGGRMTFRLAGSKSELQAFLQSKPKGEVTGQGQIVLFARGEPHYLQVEDLLAKQKAGERVKLGDSGVELEVVGYQEDGSLGVNGPAEPLALVPARGGGIAGGPAVELKILASGGRKPPENHQPARRIILFAHHPELNIYDHQGEVYGTYWFNPGKLTAAERMQGQGGSRIDFAQGQDEKLYYRYWNGEQVVALTEMPTDGGEVEAFKMPIAQLKMRVAQFVPSKRPRKIELPRPFNKQLATAQKRPAAKLRVTVDGESKEFWIAGGSILPYVRPPQESEREMVAGEDRVVLVTMPAQDMFKDVGFQVRLKKFERKLDPGTSQASHYGSVVDILAREPGSKTPGEDPEVLQKDVEISMNAPVDIVDPATGRTLRLFQESFNGPFKPGDPTYRDFADKSKGRELFYVSVLTVNYDPGRGVKYAGCWLIVAGIFTMFYMRAYFFKPAAAKQANEGRKHGDAKASGGRKPPGGDAKRSGDSQAYASRSP